MHMYLYFSYIGFENNNNNYNKYTNNNNVKNN